MLTVESAGSVGVVLLFYLPRYQFRNIFEVDFSHSRDLHICCIHFVLAYRGDRMTESWLLNPLTQTPREHMLLLTRLLLRRRQTWLFYLLQYQVQCTETSVCPGSNGSSKLKLTNYCRFLIDLATVGLKINSFN